jgi:hypothetical protein
MVLKLEPITRMFLLKRLDQEKVRLIPNVSYKEITDKGLVIVHKDGKEELVEADNVVIAAGAVPRRELMEELIGKFYDPPYEVGDCIAAGRIVDAIHSGARIGRQI